MNYQIHHMGEVDSTNLRVKEFAQKDAPEGTVAVADAQTAGRGRRGRTWISPSGSSIYMSLLLRPQIKPEQASMLTLVMGLAAAQVIRLQTGLDAKIKWPNDIVVHEKKVCGILTEMQVFPQGIEYVIIGVGVNVTQTSFPKEIEDMATSLLMEMHRCPLKNGESAMENTEADGRYEHGQLCIDKDRLLKEILDQFERYYADFLRDGDLQDMMDAYNQLLVSREREIRVLDPAGEYTGTTAGINELGELLVTKSDGSVETVYAGEVSVRGLYGYV